MKIRDFQRKMKKDIFTTPQAHVVGFRDDPKVLNLQLHQWERKGEIIRLKRGVYLFAGKHPSEIEVARGLYGPGYFSLEYALSFYGIIPEAVFTYTLVTPKLTRFFKTPLGSFHYQKIKKEAFTGFDSQSLMAEKEKALVDYFYLNSSKLHMDPIFWEASRLEAKVTGVNFKKVFRYAKLFRSPRLIALLTDFQSYARSH